MMNPTDLIWIAALATIANGDISLNASAPDAPGFATAREYEPPGIPGHMCLPPDEAWPIGSPGFGDPPDPAIPPVSRPFFGEAPPDLRGYFGANPLGAPATHPTSPQIPSFERQQRRVD